MPDLSDKLVDLAFIFGIPAVLFALFWITQRRSR